MGKNQLEHCIDAACQQFGFRPMRQQRCRRQVGSFLWLIHLNWSGSKDLGSGAISAAVRSDELEDLVGSSKESFTVGRELGNEYDGRRQSWSVEPPGMTPALQSSVAAAIVNRAIPMLTRLSSIETIYAVTKRDDQGGWGYDPWHQHRAEIAVAAALKLGVGEEELEQLVVTKVRGLTYWEVPNADQWLRGRLSELRLKLHG